MVLCFVALQLYIVSVVCPNNFAPEVLQFLSDDFAATTFPLVITRHDIKRSPDVKGEYQSVLFSFKINRRKPITNEQHNLYLTKSKVRVF